MQVIYRGSPSNEIFIEGLLPERIKMERAEMDPEVAEKYDGDLVVCSVLLSQVGDFTRPYRYVVCQQESCFEVQERHSMPRKLIISNPSTYEGPVDIEEAYEKRDDRIFIVNGGAVKFDGEFKRPFIINRLEQSTIFCGSCPEAEDDVLALK